MPRRHLAVAAVLALVGATAPAHAQPADPRAPLAPLPPSPPADLGSVTPAAAPASATPRLSLLGDPVPVRGERVRPQDRAPRPPSTPTPVPNDTGGMLPPSPSPSRTTAPRVPTAFEADAPGVRAAAFAAPTDAPRIPAAAVERSLKAAREPVPTAAPPANPDPLAELLRKREDDRADLERDALQPPKKSEKAGWFSRFGEKLGDTFHDLMGARDGWLHSDHAFDGFASPVTNPFLSEDPRALTEVRPIFIYQKVPGGQADFQGGSITWFGTQARVAFTNRFSLVVSKLGGISVNPSGSSPTFDGQTGFSELWLGAKYTFIRDEERCRLLAGGVNFQIPVGSASAFQNTGSLSIDPYVSFAQNFFSTGFGSFNGMATAGYALSVNRERSDYFHLSGHLDFDLFDRHRFYPLAELNYMLYTTNGNSTPIGAEGRDLINFGSQASGNGLLTGALGARYKISECAQVGGAFEFPLAGPRDFFDYRLTFDFILRY